MFIKYVISLQHQIIQKMKTTLKETRRILNEWGIQTAFMDDKYLKLAIEQAHRKLQEEENGI